MSSNARAKVPATASVGEVIKIKTLLKHRMESGHRVDNDGNAVPRKIINRFQCDFEGTEIFSCDIATAISSNPYLQFYAKVEKSGTFRFRWTDDDGTIIETEKSIEVS